MSSSRTNLSGILFQVFPVTTLANKFLGRSQFIEKRFWACRTNALVPYPANFCSYIDPENLKSDERFQNILRKVSTPSTRIEISGGDVRVDGPERLREFCGLLRDCARDGSVKEAKAIHGLVIKNDMLPGSHFWNLMFLCYWKCGKFEDAHKVLDEMPDRDVVFWTELISGLVSEGCGLDAINFYCKMRKDGIRPFGGSLLHGLKACSTELNLNFGQQLHAEAIKMKLDSNLCVSSALIELYAKRGELDLAVSLFLSMSIKNFVSWITLLDGYAQVGQWEDVLVLFSGLKDARLKHDKLSMVTVLKGCAHLGNVRGGQTLHALTIKRCCERDEFVSSSLLNMYSKAGSLEDALKQFERIRIPNVVAWSTVINGLDRHGRSLEAAEIFSTMMHADVRPNQFTIASTISVATSLGCRWYGKSIHACLLKYGFGVDNFLNSALVVMYRKLGSALEGQQVFDAITTRDTASWNSLLSGFHGKETCCKPSRTFKMMLMEGCKPDIYTFSHILKSCSILSNLRFGMQLHAQVVKNGFHGDVIAVTALIDMYAKSRDLEAADLIFNQLRDKDLFSWTAIMSAYARTDQGKKVVVYFSQMQKEGLKPNEFALSSCLSGCSSFEMLRCGRQFHSLVIKYGLSDNVYASNALIAMYAQCKRIEEAETVFNGLASCSIVSWNIIISGYSRNGQGMRALTAFRNMLREGVVPDEITFIGVLSACSYMGLIEEGERQFQSLIKDYGITPAVEHLACMVNILSRAGKFLEVEKFVEEWKLTDNALIWETILWASKIHGNVEFGEKAAMKLFDLVPAFDYDYILLSDIYAAQGRWDDVASIRSLMADQGIKKIPGCSWLELDDQTHTFFAQDTSHANIRDICLRLEGLAH